MRRLKVFLCEPRAVAELLQRKRSGTRAQRLGGRNAIRRATGRRARAHAGARARVVRVVRSRTSSGACTRAVVRLCGEPGGRAKANVFDAIRLTLYSELELESESKPEFEMEGTAPRQCRARERRLTLRLQTRERRREGPCRAGAGESHELRLQTDARRFSFSSTSSPSV